MPEVGPRPEDTDPSGTTPNRSETPLDPDCVVVDVVQSSTNRVMTFTESRRQIAIMEDKQRALRRDIRRIQSRKTEEEKRVRRKERERKEKEQRGKCSGRDNKRSRHDEDDDKSRRKQRRI